MLLSPILMSTLVLLIFTPCTANQPSSYRSTGKHCCAIQGEWGDRIWEYSICFWFTHNFCKCNVRHSVLSILSLQTLKICLISDFDKFPRHARACVFSRVRTGVELCIEGSNWSLRLVSHDLDIETASKTNFTQCNKVPKFHYGMALLLNIIFYFDFV